MARRSSRSSSSLARARADATGLPEPRSGRSAVDPGKTTTDRITSPPSMARTASFRSSSVSAISRVTIASRSRSLRSPTAPSEVLVRDRIASIGDEQVHLVGICRSVRAVPGDRDLTRDGWDADRDGGAREAEHLHRLAHALGPTRARARRVVAVRANRPADRLGDRPPMRRPCRWLPNPTAHSSFAGTTSTAISLVAPATRDPCRAARPMPPRPITATVAPGHTFAVWIEAPTPVETPQPSRQARERARASGIGTICGSVTTVWVARVPQCRTPVSTCPPARWRRRGWCSSCPHRRGAPRRHCRHRPHGTAQVMTTRSPAATDVTPSPTASTTPAPSWPSSIGQRAPSSRARSPTSL